jgi:rSAM/selenodomain-associated transferase 2
MEPGRESIAVIIPARNEAATIASTLQVARERAAAPETIAFIVADGASTDATREFARGAGATVVTGSTGRGAQMNAGAGAVDAENLVFLHADTLLPRGWDDLVAATLADPEVAMGAFAFAVDAPGAPMRLLERLVALRCSVLQRPYGDQALFMRTATFSALGGFAEMELLEDYELVSRARRLGAVRTLQEPAVTSGRMWKRLGVARMTWRNLVTVAGYRLGIAPAALARWRSR